MPRSRNTRIRPKDTSRVEARRRHREQNRDVADESDTFEAQEPAEAAPPSQRSAFALPNVVEDLRALPQVFRKPLVWAPFGMLLLAFLLELARQGGALPAGTVGDLGLLYIQLTLPPTSLFVFFIGGFVADRASYLVGAILGIFDALLITILVLTAPAAPAPGLEALPGAGGGVTGIGDPIAPVPTEGLVTEVAQGLLPLWAIAIFVGVFAAGFAAWYKRFLRSSQERARANRAQREREQAERAKAQAREDKQAAREARRPR